MASKKKFGAFAGVFTPSILTILGVIMYLRMGWVVGNAGLIGTIMIIIIAHVISISTGLSISSIATDKKVGAGGIYYILSRSMGIPIGGAIGITLYIGTAFSIALYVIGFAESFNGYFGYDTGINGLRISGTIALLILTAIALISTSVALKAQFFILTAIIFSLVSIFMGTHEFAPQSVQMLSGEGSVSLEIVFAIFFPAVTGFTAGIAMSGDLKDPKRSIPLGTLASIGVGLIVYLGLAFFISYNVDSEVLKTDNNILMKIALYAPAVVAGIWGATLSSALGGILGGPRILQAMSFDKITPKFFGKGRGKNNEPVNALFLVFVIAQAGILIGELDVIARIVSMFYLAAYGIINITFFLEGWANPDFQPTFKVKRWVGLVGFIASFGVMFKLDMLAMFGALIVIGGIYFWLQRKQIKLQSGNVWQSVWENIVAKGLKNLETKETSGGNWNPNIILFSGESDDRPYLLELSNIVSGNTGIVTNFNLVNAQNNEVPLTRTKQTIKDKTLDKYGIFGKKIEVDNLYEGIENIAATFGFTGIDPNTVMMGWAKNTKDPIDYARLTQKLISLDFNLLYLDYDKETKFGKYETVDLWWRGANSKNAEMMLNVSRFIIQSQKWRKAKIRILLVNHNNIDSSIIKAKISKLINKFRIDAEIKIINNAVEQRPFYKIIEIMSSDTDMVMIGVPDVKTENQPKFVSNTNNLLNIIGTTLLVKASNDFNTLDLNIQKDIKNYERKSIELKQLPVSNISEINKVISELDEHLSDTVESLSEPALVSISSNYYQFIESIKVDFDKTIQKLDDLNSVDHFTSKILPFLNNVINTSVEFKSDKLPILSEIFEKEIREFVNKRKEFIKDAPYKIRYSPTDSKQKGFFSNKKTIYWRSILESYSKTKILPNTQNVFYDLGVQNLIILNRLTESLASEIQSFLDIIAKDKRISKESINNFSFHINVLFDALKKDSLNIQKQAVESLNSYERGICIELIEGIEKDQFYKYVKEQNRKLNTKELRLNENNVNDFASDWLRNQLMAHRQAESDFSLTITGISIFGINEKIKTHINSEIISHQLKKVNSLSEIVKYVDDHLEKGLTNYKSKDLDNIAEAVNHIDFINILSSEEDEILELTGTAPSVVDLMSAKSFNDFIKCQNEDVKEIPISLSNIQSYIIQTSYLSPLQTTLQDISKVFNENSEELYTTSNLIKHIIDEPVNPDNITLYKEDIKKVQKDVKASLKSLNNLSGSFNLDLNSNTHNTISELNIRSIIESIDSYSKVSQNPIIKTNFQSWFDNKKKNVNLAYDKMMNFIIQRKQEIDTIKFEEQHNQFQNSIEQTNIFVQSLKMDPDVEKELSFYYKKLFTGSHLGTVNLKYRKKEIDTAKRAIDRIDEGVNGGIMIIGETMSGKSYLTETISNLILQGEKVYIDPPEKQNYDVNDVHLAFQKIFNKSGTTESILNQIDDGTILVFNDLEKWWVKADNGSAAINYISKIIQIFGSKHYFLLNCNIFSFDILRKSSILDESLLSTIIVSPVSRSEIKEIILKRHRTAGMDIWFNGKLVEDSKKLDAFFSDLHDRSNGNVGVALNSWINGIRLNEDKQLIIRKNSIVNFPLISKANWKVILYHFIIHDHLKIIQIQKIFGKNDNEWIFNTIKEIEKAGLIYRKSSSTYKLNHSSKYFVEKWLKEIKILN